MAKYLDDNGLLYLWQKIKTRFVEVESGKGLSTNDYTTTEKNKLAGIAEGAEVNVNADWNANSGDAQILNKPTIPTASTTNPSMDGTASYGSGTSYARSNHVHPTDTSRAPLVSPALTGTPTAPTATAGTNTTQLATTAFVTDAIATAITGGAAFQGTVSSQTTITNSNYKKGWYWVVETAGTYVGETCEVGDMIYAIKDKASAYAASDFSVVQANLDIAAITNAEIDTILAV